MWEKFKSCSKTEEYNICHLLYVYCYIKNSHKFSCLKQIHSVSQIFCGSGFWTQVGYVLSAQGLTSLQSQYH